LAIGAALAALPVRARRAASQIEFMRTVEADEELAWRRPQFRRSVAAVVQALARHAAWPGVPGVEAMTVRATWKVLQERAGRSRSTVAAVLAWLWSRGYLATVETGTTEKVRAGLLFPIADPHKGEGNRAAEYLLCIPLQTPQDAPQGSPEPTEDTAPADVPPADPDAHPALSTDGPSSMCMKLGPLPPEALPPARENLSRAHARGAGAGLPDDVPDSDSDRRTKDSTKREFPDAPARPLSEPVPCGRWTQRQRLRAAEALRAESPLLRRVSPRALRSLLTPFWREGWTGRDVLHAIDHQPDGVPWSAYEVTELRNPASFIAWRLRPWAPDGVPMLSRSRLLDLEAAERRRQERARQEAFRAAVAARADYDVRDGHPAVRAVRAAWRGRHGRAAEPPTGIRAVPSGPGGQAPAAAARPAVDPPAFTEPPALFQAELRALPPVVAEDSETIRARALARVRAERRRGAGLA
jgi:hypothetical protein